MKTDYRSTLGAGAQNYYMPDLADHVLTTVPRNAAILETGCGRGHLLWWLHTNGYENLHGCDLDDFRDEEHRGLDFTKADLDQSGLPFADESLDCVVSLHVVEHLENPWAYVREIRRVLRPSGRLLIAYPSAKDYISRVKFLWRADVPSFTPRNNHLSFFTAAVESKLFSGFRLRHTIHAPRSLPLIGGARLRGSRLWSHKTLFDYERSV